MAAAQPHALDAYPCARRRHGSIVHADVPIDDFQPADFADEGHFSPRGSLKFATLLMPQLKPGLPLMHEKGGPLRAAFPGLETIAQLRMSRGRGGAGSGILLAIRAFSSIGIPPW